MKNVSLVAIDFIDIELTKKQIIDIMLILTKEDNQEKIERYFMKGKFADISLN